MGTNASNIRDLVILAAKAGRMPSHVGNPSSGTDVQTNMHGGTKLSALLPMGVSVRRELALLHVPSASDRYY